MADSTFMHSNNLNLLLKQQIIRQIEETDEETNYELKNPEQCISINKTMSRSVLKFYCEGSELSQRCEEIKMQLVSLQVEESASSEQHKALCENYDLLENLLEHILQHIECMTLEIKSSNRLSLMLNVYAVHENYINELMSTSLKKVCERPELEIMEEIRTKLFITLNRYDNIKQLRLEYEQRKNDFSLAMKNFKIILEVMNINEKSLDRLKQQFDDVLMNFQHCRCILNQEIPFILAERTKVIAECLNLLGIECDSWAEHRLELANLLRNLGSNVRDNEYVLVRKEILGVKKNDD